MSLLLGKYGLVRCSSVRFEFVKGTLKLFENFCLFYLGQNFSKTFRELPLDKFNPARCRAVPTGLGREQENKFTPVALTILARRNAHCLVQTRYSLASGANKKQVGSVPGCFAEQKRQILCRYARFYEDSARY